MPDYLIVNLNRTYESKGRIVIRPFGRPTCIYSDREKAERELIRLAAQNKQGEDEFTLFQSIATVEYRDGQVFMKEVED